MKKLTALSNWFIQKTKPIHLAIFAVIFVVFIAYVLPNVSAATKLATGSDQAPDMDFFYTAESLYQIAETYGPAGRSYYIKSRYTFDVVWPLAYGAFLTAALSRLLRKSNGSRFKGSRLNGSRLAWLHLLNLLPILGVLFDYLENIATATAMYVFPKTIFLAYLAPYFTAIKWSCLYAAFTVLFVGIPIRLIHSLITRGRAK